MAYLILKKIPAVRDRFRGPIEEKKRTKGDDGHTLAADTSISGLIPVLCGESGRFEKILLQAFSGRTMEQRPALKIHVGDSKHGGRRYNNFSNETKLQRFVINKLNKDSKRYTKRDPSTNPLKSCEILWNLPQPGHSRLLLEQYRRGEDLADENLPT